MQLASVPRGKLCTKVVIPLGKELASSAAGFSDKRQTLCRGCDSTWERAYVAVQLASVPRRRLCAGVVVPLEAAA